MTRFRVQLTKARFARLVSAVACTDSGKKLSYEEGEELWDAKLRELKLVDPFRVSWNRDAGVDQIIVFLVLN